MRGFSPHADDARAPRLALAATGALIAAASLTLPLLPEPFTGAIMILPQAPPRLKLVALALLGLPFALAIIGQASIRLAVDWIRGERPAKDPQGIVQERHPDWNAHTLATFATRIHLLSQQDDPPSLTEPP